MIHVLYLLRLVKGMYWDEAMLNSEKNEARSHIHCRVIVVQMCQLVSRKKSLGRMRGHSEDILGFGCAQPILPIGMIFWLKKPNSSPNTCAEHFNRNHHPFPIPVHSSI